LTFFLIFLWKGQYLIFVIFLLRESLRSLDPLNLFEKQHSVLLTRSTIESNAMRFVMEL
jgi:hypothetical protein